MTLRVEEPSAKYLVEAPYKHTEVGLIPKEWDVLALADIAAIERGKFSARPRNDPKYYGGEFPFIQTGDVTRSCGSISTFTQTLNREGVRVSRLFPEGTLFFTIAANIGDVGIVKFEAACPDSLVAIVPRSGVQKGWLLYELARKKSDFESLASPGAQLNINLEKLRPYLVPVPPEAEQRAIATALSDIDALIAGLEKLIAKKRDLKQAAMQQLLTGQTRLPGFNGEWVSRSLGSLGMIYGGLVGKSKADFGHGSATYVPFVNVMANIHIDCGALEPVNVASTENQNRVLCGDLLFNGSSETPEEVALCALMTQTVEDLYLNSFCFGFRFKQGVEASGLFLTYFMRSQMGRELMKSLAQGSTRYNLSKSALLQATLVLPNLEEQTAIATVLSDIDADLSALEARLVKTRDLKQGMMQELLTGRTRLV